MKGNFKKIIAYMLSLALMGCASQPLKAPCNHQGDFCGTKTKINQW